MRSHDARGPASASDYHFRRSLTVREQLPALAVAAGAAAVAFYVARLLIQRTPLAPASEVTAVGRKGAIGRRPARRAAGG